MDNPECWRNAGFARPSPGLRIERDICDGRGEMSAIRKRLARFETTQSMPVQGLDIEIKGVQP